METSHLAKLSPELRNQIYDHVLRIPVSTLAASDLAIYNGLTRTCRQIRSESQCMFYSLNAFSALLYHKQLPSFCGFLRALGPDVLSRLRSLRLRIVQTIPCPGASLQCSQNIEIRGFLEQGGDQHSGAGYYSIRPRGAETDLCETLLSMGLQVKGQGSTWYSAGATWYVGIWEEGGRVVER